MFAYQSSRFIYNIDESNASQDPSIGSIPDGVDANINEFIAQLPLMFSFTIKDKIILGAGPQVEYVMFERISQNGNKVYDIGSLDENKFGLSYTAILGFRVNEKTQLNFRYLNSLTSRNLLRNRVFQLGMNYYF